MSFRRILLILILISSVYGQLYNYNIIYSNESNSVEIFNHNLQSNSDQQIEQFNTSLYNINVNNIIKRSIDHIKLTNNNNRKKKLKRKRLTTCKKSDFNVNFVELGWDKWIIFPKMFNAHICSGECSFKFNQLISSSSSSHKRHTLSSRNREGYVQVTNHAQIMSILEYKYPNLNKQMTKCVSTKLKPLTVVFLDDNGFIKTKQYDDMIVDECGCR